jgi:uncharacterized membrane protein
MTVKTYKLWETIIKLIVCGVVAFSVITANWIPLVVSVVAAMVIFIVLRVKVKGIVDDERTKVLMQKATYITYGWVNFLTSVAGVILIFTNRDNMSSIPAVIGFTLFFYSFGFGFIRDAVYYVLNNRTGGKTE